MSSLATSVSARFAVLLLAPALAFGQGIQLPLTDDAWVNGNNTTTNFGDQTTVFVHNFGPKEGLIKFDTSSIAGQNVTSATLKLFIASIRTEGQLSLYAVNGDWTEDTVTWANQPGFGDMLAGIVLNPGNAGSTVELPLDLVVSQWADGSRPNFGIQLVTTAGIRTFIGAKEGGMGAILEVQTDGGPPDPPDPPDPPAPPVGATVLDFTDPDACNIDQPGHYLIDRDWDLFLPDICRASNPPATTGAERCEEATRSIIHISANGVTIDLGGFTLDAVDPQIPDVPELPPIIRLTGRGAIIRNGELANNGLSICAVDADFARVESIRGSAAKTGSKSTVSNNSLFEVEQNCALVPGPGSWVMRNTLSASSLAPALCASSDTEIRFNRLLNTTTFQIADLSGDNNTFTSNFVEGSILVTGNSNTVADNIIQPEGPGSSLTGLRINGRDNVADGNIISNVRTGFWFDADDNFFGDNRINAETPIQLNGTTQIDWGGNVEFTR